MPFVKVDFISDTSVSNKSFPLDSLLDTSAGIDTSFDLEFRLWSQLSLTDISEVFILTRKSSGWHARYFELRKGKFVERAVSHARLDSLWAGISSSFIFTESKFYSSSHAEVFG